VCSLVRTLHQNFSEEFQIFGLINLLPNLISRVIVAEAWDPFLDYAYLCEIYDSLSPLVEYFEAQDQRQLARQTSKAFYDVVEQRFLPVVRRAVASGWDPICEPEVCVKLFESLRLVLPADNFDTTIDMFLLPKLTATVNTWRPSIAASDEPGVHTWVHPWLPLLTTKLSVLYPEIRRKFGTLLSSSSYRDSARVVAMLQPWMDVFDATSFENLLVRSALPRLVTVLREDLVIDPAQQDILPVQCVLAWELLVPVLPAAHLACLWVGEFFPKWLRVLFGWLTGHVDELLQSGASLAGVEAADFEEVSAWYSGWKGLFPEMLLAQEGVTDCFNLALDMMQTSLVLEGDDAPGPSSQGILPGHPMYAFKVAIERMEDANYYTLIENRKTVQRAQRRLDSLNAEDSAAYASSLKQATALGVASSHQHVTFKEVVEKFAARNNVEFVPKLGRYFEGKQLWQFGHRLCYLDQNVVFVSAAEKGGKRSADGGGSNNNTGAADSASRQELYGWAPIALEDLLL
jgi:tuftelin-interacting protein 11